MWAGRGGAPAWLHSSRALERIVSLLDRHVARIEIGVKNGGIARYEHMFVCSCVTRYHAPRVGESSKDSPTRFGRSVQGRLQVLRL